MGTVLLARFFVPSFLYSTPTGLNRQGGQVLPLRTIGFAPVLNDKRALAKFEFSIRCAVPLGEALTTASGGNFVRAEVNRKGASSPVGSCDH